MKSSGKNQPTSGYRMEVKERRRNIMELRMTGASQRHIAETLGLAKSTVSAHLNAALAELVEQVHDAAESVRALELERLDRLLVAMWGSATAGSFHATDRVLKIMERRSMLLGLDAPKRQEVTGKDGGPIQTTQTLDLASLTDEELAEIERITTAARSRGLPPGVGTPPA